MHQIVPLVDYGTPSDAVPQATTKWYQTPVGKVYAASAFVAVPLAVALSYTRNKSVGWAFVHGILIPRFYLAYRGVQYASKK